jgi:hypothetical protein
MGVVVPFRRVGTVGPVVAPAAPARAAATAVPDGLAHRRADLQAVARDLAAAHARLARTREWMAQDRLVSRQLAEEGRRRLDEAWRLLRATRVEDR